MRNAAKTILSLDLSATYASARQLKPGRELQQLHPYATDPAAAIGPIAGTMSTQHQPLDIDRVTADDVGLSAQLRPGAHK